MKILLVPIIKYPYSRIGPDVLQDWTRQCRFTANMAMRLQTEGHDVQIAIISSFTKPGNRSEIELYTHKIQEYAQGLTIVPYSEMKDTVGQVDHSFNLAQKQGRDVIFTSCGPQFWRVKYLAKGRKAQHHLVWGIPHFGFALIDPICLVFQPLTDTLGFTNLIRNRILAQRDKGRIL
jgi:hypothetical protein